MQFKNYILKWKVVAFTKILARELEDIRIYNQIQKPRGLSEVN